MNLREYLTKSKFKISYNDALQIFTNVSEQLKSLEQDKIVFSLSLDDIIKNPDDNWEITDNKFFKKGTTKITINNKDFLSPELEAGGHTESSGWYSLASIIAYCLTGKRDIENNFEELESIRETKLYWALKRILNNEKRAILLI